MDLKERVKLLCKRNGISMNQLESELNFGKGYISKLGNSKPNSEYLRKIASYFNVSYEYLLTGEEAQGASNGAFTEEELSYLPDIRKMIELGMTPAKLRALIAAVEDLGDEQA